MKGRTDLIFMGERRFFYLDALSDARKQSPKKGREGCPWRPCITQCYGLDQPPRAFLRESIIKLTAPAPILFTCLS